MKTQDNRLAQILHLSVVILLFLFAFGQPVSIAAAEIAYSAAAFAWVLYLIAVKGGTLRGSPLDLPILIYLLLCTVSTLMSPLPASSWEGMRKVTFVFLALLVAHNVANRRRAKQLLAVLFLSGMVSATWAGWQYARGVGLRVHQIAPGSAVQRAGLLDNDVVLRVDGRLIRKPAQLLARLNSKPAGEPLAFQVVHDEGDDTNLVLKNAVRVVVPAGAWVRAGTLDQIGGHVEVARPLRASSFYGHFMNYAFVLVLLAPLPFGLWLASPRYTSATGVLFGALFLAFALALGLTLTRSAWLAVAIGCAVQAWIHLRRYWKFLLLPLALVVVFAGTDIAMHRWRGKGVIDFSDPGTDYRLLMWRDGLRIIREHPWFGVGINTVRDAWWRFNLAAYKKYGLRLHFHSTVIQIAVEMGIPVLLSWLALMGCYYFMLLRLAARARQQGDAFVYGLSLGIIGATVGFLAGSLVQYDFGDSLVVLLFWFLAGLALAMERLRKDPATG